MTDYTQGSFAPVTCETTAYDLHVDGTVPPELAGRYVRTGPNPTDPNPDAHWFVGDGMLHGVRLEGGTARWYANRWVRSPELAARFHLPTVPEPGPAGTPGTGRFNGSGNTNVIHHAGRIFGINELSLPYEIAPDLSTVRRENFGGALPAGTNAHPKFDPDTNELHVVAYDVFEPVVWYHVVGTDGRLRTTERIDVPAPIMVHDMGLTDTSVLILDLSVEFSLEAAMGGSTFPFRWNPEHTPRVGVMPRTGGAADIVWCETDPDYVFHPLNAYDAGDGTIIADMIVHPSMFDGTEDPLATGIARLHRWTIDPATGKVRNEMLDDRHVEFPRADERRAGRKHRYGYAVGSPAGGEGPFGADGTLVVKYDVTAGTSAAHDLGPGRIPGEFVFVPRDLDDRSDAGEDDGWLMGYVHDQSTATTDLVVLDARDITAPAVATVHLPVRVPFGFHGNWIPDRALTAPTA